MLSLRLHRLMRFLLHWVFSGWLLLSRSLCCNFLALVVLLWVRLLVFLCSLVVLFACLLLIKLLLGLVDSLVSPSGLNLAHLDPSNEHSLQVPIILNELADRHLVPLINLGYLPVAMFPLQLFNQLIILKLNLVLLIISNLLNKFLD